MPNTRTPTDSETSTPFPVAFGYRPGAAISPADEPGFKTPWRLTLRVPRDLVAIANSQVESETVDGDGLKTVRFKPTRPLPTYLVAFAVGPWQSVDLGWLGAGATPSRIVVPAGRTDDTSFAAQSYPELFTQLERWFAAPA